MRVLVVDDEAEIRRIVRRSLEREGFQDVVEAADAAEALRAAEAAAVDVAVLDVRLPGMSGLDLLSELRECHPDVHVIMLTGAGSEADRVLGLVSGADDYMVKPFSARELAARVIAVSRRRAPVPAAIVDHGGLRIDATTRTATLAGEPIELTRREFDLLYHLASHPGRAFTRAELLQSAWGSSPEGQSEATVTEHVRRVRQKIELDPAHPVRLVTARGSGYRFVPDGPSAPRAATDPQRLGDSASGLTQEALVVIAGDVIVHANAAALAQIGAAKPSDVVGHVFFDFVAPQSLGASMARQQGAREGRWARPEIITIRRIDGSEVLVEVASMPVLWDGLPASQVTLWDLAGDTSKLRELATGIRTDVAEAIMITDTNLRIRSFNPAAEILYGWREEEVVGRSAMEVLPWLRDDATAADARMGIQRHGRWQSEVVQRRRDGSAVTVMSSSTLLRDGADQPVGVISVNRPVTAAGSRSSSPEPVADPHLDVEIRRGIERGEFTLHYQPVVSLADEAWHGVEALVRWEHPERGLLGPAAFIDAAERSGAIVDLGQLVLDQATQQWAAWHRSGIDLQVAVNLSGRQLADPSLTDRLAGVIANVAMPPGALWLEVTETSLVEDLDLATKALRRVAELGANVSIDDFGTGWASLTYLREFPVHALKVDRVFVAGLGRGITDTAIVNSIISLAAELGLAVVAEGIETAEQLDRLVRLGCQVGQGYLFARPQPPGEITAALGG